MRRQQETPQQEIRRLLAEADRVVREFLSDYERPRPIRTTRGLWVAQIDLSLPQSRRYF